MKGKNKKFISLLLSLCLLPVQNISAYADNNYAEEDRIYRYEESKSSGFNASKVEEQMFERYLENITPIYDTDLILTEDEIQNGVKMPSYEEFEDKEFEYEEETDDDRFGIDRFATDEFGTDEFDTDESDINEFDSEDPYLFDEEFDIDSLIKKQAFYTAAAPKKYIDSSQLDAESRIPSVYDEETKVKLRGLIMGGSDRVKYFADQMTFGISPIYAPTSSRVGNAFDEAIWQNQMILEEDILDISKDPFIYEDENGNTYYRYDIEYQISDPVLRKKYQLQMYDKAQKIIDDIGMYTNGRYVEELYEINNYIIDHSVYAQDIVSNRVTHTMQRKAYGILVEGRGICSAYARAFQLVARMAGFTCVVDGGRAVLSKDRATGAVQTGPHAWNMVYMNSGQWLMVDPTFNDNGGEGFSTPENSYLLIPKNASQRNRISDGRCFAKKGIFTNIEQHSDDFSCDYLNYIGKSAASSDESVDKLCEYINKGFVPRNFRFQWGVSEAELSGMSDEIYARTGLKLRISTTGYDAYLATLSKLENHSGKAIRSTDRGLYQIVLKNGIYTESKLRYPDNVYTRGRKATDSNADESSSGSGASGSTSGSTSSGGGASGASSGSTSSDSTSSVDSTSGRTSSGGGASGASSGSTSSDSTSSVDSTSGRTSSSGGASDTGRGSLAKSASPKKNTSLTGSWVQDIKGWWYKNTDNSYPKNEWKEIDSKWYVFNAEGYMITGWYYSNSHWYFLDQSGKLLTGWIKTNGKWYYLEPAGKDTKPKGAMYVDEMTEDGYKLGTDGAWIFE